MPRAQSGRGYGRSPGAWTSDSSTAVVAVDEDACSLDAQLARFSGRVIGGVADGKDPDASPRNAVQCSGAGVHARMRRSTAMAGSVHDNSGILDGDLWGQADPLDGLRNRLQRAGLDPVQGGYEELSARASEPVQQRRWCPVAAMGSVTTPYTGPVSRPSSRRNVLAPVTSSPCRTACCTGAAPRQAGSKLKCRLIQPYGGMASATGGTSAPYATTGQQSGASSVSAVEEGGVADPRGRHDRDADVVSAGRDWATCGAAASSGRSVGTGDDSNDLVPGGE